MRDAFGGIVNIVIIVVFLVLVSGYLAFNVNYTKAFRVKNKIISTYEQYEGSCDQNSQCERKIKEYMTRLGYNAPNMKEDDPWDCRPIGYCVQEVPVISNNGDKDKINDRNPKSYYKIKTQINIDIPIVNKIMPGLRIFEVTGDTKVIEKG